MRRYALLISLLAMLTACQEDGGERRLVASKGLPSELLLVVDRAVWESDVADTLKHITQGDVPGLPQSEEFFRVTRIHSQYYGRPYTTMHSQLFVRLNPEREKPLIGLNTDVEARPQVQVTVEAPDLASLRGILSRQGEAIRQMLLDAQLEQMAEELRRHHSRRVATELQRQSPYTVCVPEEIQAVKRGKDFLWAGTNANDRDINFVYYSYPYDGSEIFYEHYFAQHRDSVMRQNVPGSTPEQWMATTWMGGQPLVESRVREVGGQTVQEVHGLWEMHGGGIGGPFVSLVRVDTLARRVVVCEGFVYSPRTDKRDLVRRMEASLRTLRRK